MEWGGGGVGGGSNIQRSRSLAGGVSWVGRQGGGVFKGAGHLQVGWLGGGAGGYSKEQITCR